MLIVLPDPGPATIVHIVAITCLQSWIWPVGVAWHWVSLTLSHFSTGSLGSANAGDAVATSIGTASRPRRKKFMLLPFAGNALERPRR
jgi:hypothetical protein